MKKDSYENQRERPQSQYRKPYDRRPPYQHRPSKKLMFLKSTVFALFIVLVVLAGAFAFIKNKGGKNLLQNFSQAKCAKASEIKLSSHVEEMKVKGDVITVLTKPSKANMQEIVRIDANCGSELGRILIKTSE